MPGLLIVWGLLLGAGVALALLARTWGDRPDRLKARLRELSRPTPRPGPRAEAEGTARPGLAGPLLPGDAEQRTRLQARLLHAGCYGRHALGAFLGVKTFLMFIPWVVGLAVGWSGRVPLHWAVTAGALVSLLGMVAPSFWLDARKARRLAVLRRGLPDALDVLVLCLEGGLSLPSAFQRVSAEIRSAFPLLGLELTLVQRETQLGQSLGEALKRFADRCDFEEAGILAGVIEQTERFGVGLVRSLRTHAEQLRFRRLQRSEERAQKAAAKILFPTLLFIFPGIFVVLLGPAALRVKEVMDRRNAPPAAPSRSRLVTDN